MQLETNALARDMVEDMGHHTEFCAVFVFLSHTYINYVRRLYIIWHAWCIVTKWHSKIKTTFKLWAVSASATSLKSDSYWNFIRSCWRFWFICKCSPQLCQKQFVARQIGLHLPRDSEQQLHRWITRKNAK